MTTSVLRRCQAPKCKIMFDLDMGDKSGLCTYHLRERVKELEHQLNPRALNAVQAERLLAERVRDMQLELTATRAKLEWFEKWAEQVDKVLQSNSDDCGSVTPMDLVLWESENPKP